MSTRKSTVLSSLARQGLGAVALSLTGLAAASSALAMPQTASDYAMVGFHRHDVSLPSPLATKSLATRPSGVTTVQPVGFKPPGNLGAPGRREGGGSRGEAPVLLLLPRFRYPNASDLEPLSLKFAHYGKTASDRPSFCFLARGSVGVQKVDFYLYDGVSSVSSNPIYQASTPIAAGGTDTLTCLQFPEIGPGALPTLEPDREYSWIVLPQDASGETLGAEVFKGFIERVDEVPPDDSLTEGDSIAFYRDRDLWYDALAVAVKMAKAGDASKLKALLETAQQPQDESFSPGEIEAVTSAPIEIIVVEGESL